MKELLFSYVFVIFIIITYAFSFFEKIVDYEGTLGWMKTHFKNTPIRKWVPLGLKVLLLAEASTFLLSVYSLIYLALYQTNEPILYTNMANIFCLLLMLIGQRWAKDFDGARTIVIYLIPSLLAIIYL